MVTEYVLWGTKIGAEDWREEILWHTTDGKRWRNELDKAKAWAKENGYDRLRTKVFGDDDVPNAAMFAKTLNI